MAEALKDSKVAWIGEIPEDWKVERISTLYSPRNTKVSDEDYPPLSVTMQGILPQLETVAKTDDHSNRKLVKKGDFAINSRSDRRGSCGISSYDGSVSLINIVLRPNSKMNPVYYNWLFHTSLFADEFYRWGHGIVDDLWTTNWQDMKNIFVAIPPLEEQEQIAIFLNEKCAEIDKLSDDIQRQIDILNEYKKSVITHAVTKGLNPSVEMKDSGVQWIGKIPATYPRKKIKNVCSMIGSGTTPQSSNPDFYTDGTINWIQSGDIYGKELIEDVSIKVTPVALYSSASLKVYKAPFIVIAMYGGSVGNSAISHINACTNQAVCCLKPDTETDLGFLYYWIQFCKEDFLVKAEGGGQPNISQDKIKNQWIILPPKREQIEIVNYLNKKMIDINGAIRTKQRQLDNLGTYKKSIIYEYVTGKKRVA